MVNFFELNIIIFMNVVFFKKIYINCQYFAEIMLINICMSNAQFCWIDFFFFLKIYINSCMYMASITWLNVWVLMFDHVLMVNFFELNIIIFMNVVFFKKIYINCQYFAEIMLINICMGNAQFCWIDFFFFLKVYINSCMYMTSITWLNVWVNNDIFFKYIFVIIIVIISNIYKLCLIISNYVLVLTYYALPITYYVLVLCIPIIF